MKQLTLYAGQRPVPLNQTSRDWHIELVTLSVAKGLAVRTVLSVVEGFFASLRMTAISGRRTQCPDVVWFDLENGGTAGPAVHASHSTIL